MIADIPFIRKTFGRFNDLCFGGVLPQIPIVLTKAGSFLGKMEYRQKRDMFGNVAAYDGFRMKISTSFDLPEEELEDVVIHEMIHYYIAYRNIKDSSVHGEVFRRMMDLINLKYGRHINVRHKGGTGRVTVRNAGGNFRKYIICISSFAGGDKGVTVCASTRISGIYRLLPKHYRITGMEWYVSCDPFFSRYPRSNTPKIYRITEDEISEHLKDAVRLRWDGHALKPSGGR